MSDFHSENLARETASSARHSFKMLMKDILPPVLFRFLARVRDRHKKYNGLYGLDKKLEAYLGHRDGFFVELGANDGVRQSNTLYFEKHKGWRGILVEPVPHNYLKCFSNRSRRNHIYCKACVSFQYKEPFVAIAFADLMSTAIGLESDIADPLANACEEKIYSGRDSPVFVFGASASTLNELLIDAEAPRLIDLLSLDVEGAEVEVLKGIDHGQFRFRFLCIECRDFTKLNSYLKTHGYEFVEELSFRDFLFRDTASVEDDSQIVSNDDAR